MHRCCWLAGLGYGPVPLELGLPGEFLCPRRFCRRAGLRRLFALPRERWGGLSVVGFYVRVGFLDLGLQEFFDFVHVVGRDVDRDAGRLSSM